MRIVGPAIRLRVAEFRCRAEKAGLITNGEIGARLGVERTTVYRILREEMAPGERFIAATLAAFPQTRFEDVFEVTVPRDEAGTAA